MKNINTKTSQIRIDSTKNLSCGVGGGERGQHKGGGREWGQKEEGEGEGNQRGGGWGEFFLFFFMFYSSSFTSDIRGF